MDKNKAVSMKFGIFNPTMPSAIHVRPNPITSAAIAPVTICFIFNMKFSFLVLIGILLIAIKMIAELGSNPSPTTPFVLITSILEFLNENSDFMKAVLSPKGDLSFQTKLKDFMWKTLFEDTNGALINKENLLVPSQYLASYMASAHTGVIQQWLNNGQKETPEEIARILSTIAVHGPFYAAGLKK